MNNKPKFIVDFMCGRLAKWLRIIGYDTVFYNDTSRNKILLDSLQQQRIILTRDTHLSKKKAYKIILINSSRVREQVKQVVKELKLKIDKNEFFNICSLCNQKVQKVKDKQDIKDLVPRYVFENTEEFYICPSCKHIYWKGSHYDLFLKEVEKIL
ncbi:MAG: Mut7-C RNAse domain-containing protein [Endomicrobia bacterium]|nr:Mut7-C RNAse domain-containing protein [Endomicrobiia bacterium]